MLSFHRFDPAPCGFPRPQVPVLPPLSWAQLRLRGSAADSTGCRHFARGRYALRAAYELAGVGPRGALLAPSYHCRTMLDGAVRLGGEVGLYPLTGELEPDIAGLEFAASTCRTPPAALLFTHYFGLPRDIAPVAEWCRRRGIVLVEDCSHALVAEQPPRANGASSVLPMGTTGHYAAASPYKFYPCPDGGLLWSPLGAPLPAKSTRAPGLRAQLRGAWHALQQVRRRHAAPDDMSAEAALATLAARPPIVGRDWIEDGRVAALSAEYAIEAEALDSLAVSRWIQRHADVAGLVKRRRERFMQWADAVAGLSGCQALFASLPAGSTPYMFPLLVQDPPRRFYPLKQLGVPIWRWDDMAVSSCAVSQRYRQGVFHLPCHQALGDGEMRWMISALQQVMRL